MEAPPTPPLSALRSALAAAGLSTAAAGIAVGLASVSPVLALAVGATAVVALASSAARPSAEIQLGAVLALLTFQLFGGDGTAVGEALSGVALVAYLGTWYATAALRSRRVVTSGFDVAAVAWGLLGIPVASLWGLWMGSDLTLLRADLLAAIPFLLYLPVKDLCARREHGALIVAGALVAYGIAGTTFAIVNFREVLSSASEAWQIADARYNLSETGITSGLLLSLLGIPTAWRQGGRGRYAALALFGLALFLLGGLVLTKSRGFWAAGLIGMTCLVGLARGADRRGLVVSMGLIAVTLVGAAVAALGTAALLLAVGTLNRLATLESAITKDLSLLNRFAESSGAWELIRQRPLLGWGFGRSVPFFDIILLRSTAWGFLHNGYLALWLKTGLGGLLLMGTVWAGAIFRGMRATARTTLSPLTRSIAVSMTATLISFTPVVSTSNPFSVLDQMLVVTLLMGALHGLADRSRWMRPRS